MNAWVAFFVGAFVWVPLGCVVMGALLRASARVEARSLSGEETEALAEALGTDQRFQAGYRYGLMIGHERGWRDAECGRVA